MIFNMSGGSGSNAGLNFKVVGGNEAPVSPSENTIWVTPPQLLDFESWAENVLLIKSADNGSLGETYEKELPGDNSIIIRATGSSQTVDYSRIHTNYEDDYAKIPCKAGRNYIITWIAMGQTNAGFVEVYPSGLVDNVIRVGSHTGTIVYTPTAGVEFFTISFGVYALTSSETSIKFSNISIVEEAAEITEWAMASENPYSYEIEVDYLSGQTITAGYIGQYGDIMTQSTTNKELYTETYIPVRYGYNYTYNYTIASSKSMWLSIIEYTANHTFSKRIVSVNAVTGTTQTGKYSPSSSEVIEVRLAWRTFGLETTVDFKGIEETADASADGAVWIHTAVNSDARFNALKKNDLEVYPVRAKQFVNNSWVELVGHSYKNGVWKQWVPYGALYWYGDLCEEVSGGEWTPKKVKPNSETSDEYDLPTVTYNFDHLLINWSIAGWGGGAAKMLNSQDLTDVSLLQLEFEAELLQNPAQLYMSVYSKESSYHSDSVATVQLISKDNGSPQAISRRTVTLDVSALSGAHYVRFYGWDSWSATNSTINLKVYSLRKIYNE